MEHSENNKSPSINFYENNTSNNILTMTQRIRINGIANLTNIPIKELENVFLESIEGITELEKIILYLNKKYDLYFNRNITPLIFILTIIKIPRSTLIAVNANEEEFYQGLTLFESCEILFRKILGGRKIPSKDGFPRRLNYTGNNNIQKISQFNIDSNNCYLLFNKTKK